MNDTLNLTGVVATTPRHVVTAEGLAIASFRLASAQRRYNRATNTWSDGDTNWYTVTAFRQLAHNIASSIHRGERVILSGRLRLKPWQQGDRNGLNVEIDADTVGHDLNWGTASFVRVQHSAASDTAAPQSSQSGHAAPISSTEAQLDAWSTIPEQTASTRPAADRGAGPDPGIDAGSGAGADAGAGAGADLGADAGEQQLEPSSRAEQPHHERRDALSEGTPRQAGVESALDRSEVAVPF